MTERRNCTAEPNSIPLKGRITKKPPTIESNKWPAIIFAVRRKVKAIGRIKFLRSSTNTINLIKKTGVPTGIKWAKKCFIELNQQKKIIPTQKEKEKGKVTSMWEVTEKIKGKRAKKLQKNTKTKIELINK